VLKKQGDDIIAGEPIVKLDLQNLEKEYDLTTMLIVTNDNNKTIHFKNPGPVVEGQVIAEITE
jgi:PTS system glucose-specific IIA component